MAGCPVSADQESDDYLSLIRAAHENGRAEAEREMGERWDRIAAPVTNGEPSNRELEERRWGAGGREHFGDPRAGDFPGGPVKWAEPERPQPSGRVPSPRQDIDRATAAATTAARSHKEPELEREAEAG